MKFSGYIPLYRGLVEHTIDGRLTNNEALTFVWLLMLADKETGSYTINGPTLRFFLPGLSKSGAQDALEGLERKGYIYREVKPRSPLAYRYWIAGFQPTAGEHKGRQLDLSEVFRTKNPSKLRYVAVPPDTPPPRRPDTPLGTPNYNETREERSKKRDNSSPIGVMPNLSLERSSDDADRSHQRCDSEAGGCAHEALHDASPNASPNASGTGLRWKADGTNEWLDAGTGEAVALAEVRNRFKRIGLDYRGGSFTANGNRVSFEEALRRGVSQ